MFYSVIGRDTEMTTVQTFSFVMAATFVMFLVLHQEVAAVIVIATACLLLHHVVKAIIIARIVVTVETMITL